MRFAEDHPAAAGHFPGDPIIPGALLLDAALRAIAGATSAKSCEIRAVKFLRLVRPGDRMRIEWKPARGEAHFRCLLVESGDIAVTGTLRLVHEPT
jgi:3-hydroxymyristoyl/3-hydroxydecanoyl-(acyl carrier protein) dehydratase